MEQLEDRITPGGLGGFGNPIGSSVQFSTGAFSIPESAGYAIITALRTGSPTTLVTVDYATGNSTAYAGTDYSSDSGTLTFGAGSTSQSFAVPLLGHAESSDVAFTLTLRNPVGISLGVPSTETVTLQQPPTASNASTSVHQGQTTSLDLVSYGSDPNSLPLTASIVTSPSHGSVAFNSSTGHYDYSSDSSYTGSDSFTYKINDGIFDSNTATIAIDVTGVTDHAPVASDIGPVSVLHGQTATIDLAANTSDIDGDALNVSVVQGPSHGYLYLNSSTNKYSYVASGNYTGSDSFTYKANDGTLDSNTAIVSINVTDVAPVAGDFGPVSVLHGQTATIDLAANTSDADGDALSVSIVQNPAHGYLYLNSSTNKYSYVASNDYTGSDSFTYKANDGALDSDTATVSINVTDHAPTASDIGTMSVLHGQMTTIDLAANVADADNDTLSISIAQNPSHGYMYLNSSTNKYSYVASNNYTGSDSFSYKANDGALDSNTATVFINVTDVAPVANAIGSVSVLHGQSTNIDLNANVSDADGDTLNTSIVQSPTHGSVSWNWYTGKYVYSAYSNYTGSDSFTYKANDGALDSNTTTVSINVIDQAPVANAIGPISALPGQIATIDLAANTSDADSDTLNISIVQSPSHGYLSFNWYTNTYDYYAYSNYAGSDSFTYKANDGALDSNTATVSISVTDLRWNGPTATWNQSPSSPPVIINPGDQSNAEGDTVSLTVLATDPGNYPLRFDALNLPVGLSIDSSTGIVSGTVDYAAAEDFGGSYDPTIITSDYHGGSASVSFVWTIAATSRAPTLTQPNDQTNSAGDTVSLQVVASDPDGNQLFYSATGLPSGVFIDNSSGFISGTIDLTADSSTPYVVTVSVEDGNGSTSQTFNWTVTTVNVSVTNPGDQTSQEGDAISLQVTGSAGSTPIYSASGLPDGLSIDSSSGLISGRIAPGAAANGSFNVILFATNTVYTASQSFVWTVDPMVNITAINDQANNDGDTISLQVVATDANSNTLTYSADGLPNGLSIDSAIGLISGTLTSGDAVAGPSYVVTVTVTDGTYSTSLSFTWNVSNPNNTLPTLTNPGPQTNQVGGAVDFYLAANDADGDSLNFTADGLPDGIDIDANTGEISGTVADDAGSSNTYSVTLTVDDGQGGTATQSFVWFINAAPLTGQGGTALSATKGNDSGDLTLATFTTPDSTCQASDFMVLVNWGDGTSDEAAVDGSSGSFTVTDDHAYMSVGTYTVSIDIANNNGATTETTVSTTVSVTDAAMTLTGGVRLGTVANTQPSLTLAVLSDTNINSSSSDFTVSINWGDGSTPTQGLLSTGQNAEYAITGQHAYSAIGTYTATITVTDADGATISTTSTIVVGNVYAGIPTTLTLATFTDASPTPSPSNFTVSVLWGDGTTGTGIVTQSGTTFTVTASHTFTTDSRNQNNGVYHINITVNDEDNGFLSTSVNVNVVPAVLTGVAQKIAPTQDLSFTNTLALFTDPNLSDLPANLSVNIHWGDGTSSSGQLTGGNGLLNIVGTHLYSLAGNLDGYIEVFRQGAVEALLPMVFAVGPILGRPQLLNATLSSVLLANYDNWKVWADPLLGRNLLAINMFKVNALIQDRTLTIEQAAAVAILKAYILQKPSNLDQVGDFAALFDVDQRHPFLTEGGIRLFAGILGDPTATHHAAAVQLQGVFQRYLNRLSNAQWAVIDTQQPTLDPNLFPDQANSASDNAATVQQGAVGDCSFMSAVIGYVRENNLTPLRNRITRLGLVVVNGRSVPQYRVNLFNLDGQQRNEIVLEPTPAERALFGGTTDGTRWLSILEKAYMQAFQTPAAERILITGASVYDVAANGERMDNAIIRVTGRAAAQARVPGFFALPTTPQLRSRLNMVNNGRIVTVGSKAENDLPEQYRRIFPDNHAFAVVAFNNNTGLVTLRNPWNNPALPRNWGTQFTLGIDEFRRLFSLIAVQEPAPQR